MIMQWLRSWLAPAEKRASIETILGGWVNTASGISVTEETALRSTAVFACVRVLSETVASLPLIVYERIGDGKQRAINHPLYRLLHEQPNPEMTAFELREIMMAHLLLWGNAYVEIQRNAGGRIVGMWPLRPDRVDILRDQMRNLVYRVQLGGGYEYLPSRQVMHVRAFGVNGEKGISPIQAARQSVALGLAAEEFGNRFFRNGARTSMVLTHPGSLSEDARLRLEAQLNQQYVGLSNAHRMMVLEEGMSASSVGMPPEDAQLLETRKYQVEDIARIYRVPLHKIGSLDRATFSNIEHQALEFVTDSVVPWATRIEQKIQQSLINEPKRFFVEHLVDGLLRGDIASRYNAYSIGRTNGWLSANDIRRLENMNPIPDGDIYLVPMNMMPASQVSQVFTTEPGQPEPPAEAGQRSLPRDIETRARNIARSRNRIALSYRRVIADAVRRVIKREIADIRRAARKYLGQRSIADFTAWLTEFYRDHREFWQRNLLPVLVTFAEQIGANVAEELGTEVGDIAAFIAEYVAALAARESDSGQRQLEALLNEADDPAAAITQRLDEWQEKRADKISMNEAIQAANAVALTFYVAARVTRIRWVAQGPEDCPYCRALDGRVVGVRENFLDADTDFQPDGAERPLSIRRGAQHPPVHDGCDCMITAS